MFLPIITIVITLPLTGFGTFSSPSPPIPHWRVILKPIFNRPRISQDFIYDLPNPMRPNVHCPSFDRYRIIQDGPTGMTLRFQGL